MKKALRILLLFMVTVPYFAQYTSKTVLEEIHFFINSTTNINGKTRIVVLVNLPLNKVVWYYRYSCLS